MRKSWYSQDRSGKDQAAKGTCFLQSSHGCIINYAHRSSPLDTSPIPVRVRGGFGRAYGQVSMHMVYWKGKTFFVEKGC